MTILYLDCFSGISGDMVLGSFIDAGLPLKYLDRELKKIGVGKFRLKIRSKSKHHFKGTDLSVEVIKEPELSNYSDIVKVIKKSRLSSPVKNRALSIFECLARAEAKVHRCTLSKVHFHEVGGLDSILDIVGTAVAIDYFGIKKIYSSPLPVSRGFVKSLHGRLPVPAPATLEMIKGIPLEASPVKGEIVTPTGAAIIKALSSGFGSSPLRKIERTGYGFGDKEYPGIINAMRIFIGEGAPLFVVETNIDDMNPEFYPYIIDRLMENGAVDAVVMPVIMKHGRPAAMIQFLCEEKERKKLIGIVMKETTTFGVRYFPVERETAEREIKKVKTKYGFVNVKIARYNGSTTTVAPEYRDCAKIAKKKNVPIKVVYNIAMAKASSLRSE